MDPIPIPEPEPEAEPSVPGPEPEMVTNSPELVVDPDEPEAEAEPNAPGSLQLWWCFHYYIFGTIFLCLACYALYSTIRSLSESSRSSRRVSSIGACILAIKLLLITMGATRALYMFLYRRYTEDLAWKITRNILQNVAYPCMTGGFGLMCQILYEASRLKASSRSTLLANKIALAVVISSHFVAVITAVTLIELVDHFLLTLLVCHGFFIVWGIFLIVTFILFSRRLLEAERKSAQAMADIKSHENLSYTVSTGGAESQASHPNDLSPPPYNDGSSRSALSGDHMKQQSPASGGDSAVRECRGNSGHYHKSLSVMMKKPPGTTKGEATATDKNGRYQAAPRVHGPVCSKRGFRVKLTRKVMRIANATAILATCSVALNSLFVVNDVASYYHGWTTSAVVVYVFTTLFRCVELGMGFTMAYFTTQSIKRDSGRKATWLKRLVTKRLKSYRADRPAELTAGADGSTESGHKTMTDSAS